MKLLVESKHETLRIVDPDSLQVIWACTAVYTHLGEDVELSQVLRPVTPPIWRLVAGYLTERGTKNASWDRLTRKLPVRRINRTHDHSTIRSQVMLKEIQTHDNKLIVLRSAAAAVGKHSLAQAMDHHLKASQVATTALAGTDHVQQRKTTAALLRSAAEVIEHPDADDEKMYQQGKDVLASLGEAIAAAARAAQ
jgi:hypothetical protein